MKTAHIYIIKTKAINRKYDLKDECVHYIAADDCDSAVNQVTDNLRKAGWEVLDMHYELAVLLDIRGEVR